MVVLSIGMEIPPAVTDMAKRMGIELTEGRFCKTDSLQPGGHLASRGSSSAGPSRAPRTSRSRSSTPARRRPRRARSSRPARNTLTKVKEAVPETNVVNERPRIGVFVCRCGVNIAGVVDVPSVAEYAKSLPYVEFATDNLYSCSQDTQETISQIIKQKNLNRVVVAACTPEDPRAALPGDADQRRPEQVPVRDGQHPQPRLLGAPQQPGAGDPEGQGPGAHGRLQGGPHTAAQGSRAGHQPDRAGHRRRPLRHGGRALARPPGVRDPHRGARRAPRRAGPEPLPDGQGRGRPAEARPDDRRNRGRPEDPGAPQHPTQQGGRVCRQLQKHADGGRCRPGAGARGGRPGHGRVPLHAPGIRLRHRPAHRHQPRARPAHDGRGRGAEDPVERGLHPVRGLARARAALLLARVLHPLGGQRHSSQGNEPGDERFRPLPRPAHLRRAGGALQKGARHGRHLHPLRAATASPRSGSRAAGSW